MVRCLSCPRPDPAHVQTWYGTVQPGHLATTALLAASYLEGGGWSEEMVRMTGQVRTGPVIGLSALFCNTNMMRFSVQVS